MATTVQRWGNSLGIRIPKKMADQLHLGSGAAVELSVEDDVLVVRRAGRSRRPIAQIVKQMRRDHRGDLVDCGPPVGKEIW